MNEPTNKKEALEIVEQLYIEYISCGFHYMGEDEHSKLVKQLKQHIVNQQSKLDKIKRIVDSEIDYQNDYSIKAKDYTLLKTIKKVYEDEINER